MSYSKRRNQESHAASFNSENIKLSRTGLMGRLVVGGWAPSHLDSVESKVSEWLVTRIVVRARELSRNCDVRSISGH